MPFIHTIPPEDATGTLKENYDREVEAQGRISPVTEAWSLRPNVLPAWHALISAIASPMERRHYLLATLVASSRVKCSV
jgi:hypothetical protein